MTVRMISSPPLLLALALALALAARAGASSSRPQKILLSDVQLLTLRGSNALTAHRRVPSIPQLKCVSAPALCALATVDIMRCTNEGSSYGAEDIEWSCTTDLPPELRLAVTDVICEGFRDADDPYILRGSCGVEYTLALTELGERTYPDIAHPKPAAPKAGAGGGAAADAAARRPWFDDGRGGEDLSAWLFALIFLAVCGWIIHAAWVARSWTPPRPPAAAASPSSSPSRGPAAAAAAAAASARGSSRSRRAGGNKDRYDDKDGDDLDGGRDGRAGWMQGWGAARGPPPPYSDRRADYVATKRDYERRAHDHPADYAYTHQRGWTPGFWSGLAGGSAAGYMAGRSSNGMGMGGRLRRDEDEYRAAWEAGPPIPRPSTAARSSSSRADALHPSQASGSATTSRSERYESTGLGSTRRR